MNTEPLPSPRPVSAPVSKFQLLLAESQKWQSVENEARARNDLKAAAAAQARIVVLAKELKHHRRAGCQRAPFQISSNPHLGTRRTTHRQPKGGAFFPEPEPSIRVREIAARISEANATAKAKADRRTFRDWMAGKLEGYELTEEQKSFAREHKLHLPMPEHGFRRPQSDDALDGADRELIPEADIRGTRNGKPIVTVENAAIEAMEPQTLSVDVENLSQAEIESAAEDFGDALRWALTPSQISPVAPIVHLGLRSAVVIAALRGDLAGGLFVEPVLARHFLASFHDFRLSETLARLQATGAIYGRFLEWMRRATDLAGLGERLQLVAYELRPDLIDAGTLEELGSEMNKTRQAKDKGVNCLRDTFAGLKALAMRPDITRLRCRLAQLQPA